MLNDLRYAVRLLRRSPGFTAAAVLTLALGIGANTAIYSVLQAVWVDAVPFPDPGRLVVVSSLFERGPGPVSDEDYADWRRDNTVFSEMGTVGGNAALLRLPDNPATFFAQRVSASLFSVLDARIPLGRPLIEADERADAPFVVVISHGFWQRHFGGDPNVLGRTLPFTPVPATIVGIAPPDFRVSRGEPVGWVPRRALETRRSRGARDLTVVARLKPGVSLAQAADAMNVISGRLAAAYPDTNRQNTKADVQPLRDRLIGAGVGDSLFLLFGATALVLLIACANAANLFLARAADRRRELAVRLAVGADRWRIIRQTLAEASVVALMGAGLAIAALFAGLDALIASMPYNLPRTDAIGIDIRVLLFTLLIAIATTALAGLLPAMRAAAIAPLAALGDGSANETGAGRRRTSQALIAAEVALSLVVLSTSALLVGSFVRLVRTDPGFDPHGVLVMRLRTPPSLEQASANDILSQLSAIPGVRAVAGIETAPFGGGRVGYSVRFPGRPTAGDAPQADIRRITPRYFETMGIPLRDGRDLTAEDRKGAPLVAIVNETAARTFWPGESAIGQRIQSTQREAAEVVAVVGDVHHQALDSAPAPEVYVPILQEGVGGLVYVVRTDGEPLARVAALQAAIERMPGTSMAAPPQTMDEYIVRSVHVPRFRALLFGLLGVLVLALTAIGVFSVTAHAVVQRRREIGIRIALGARPGQVIRLVVRQTAAPVVIGAVLGIAGALNATRLVTNFLFRTTPSDPLMFAGAVGLVFGAALLAAYVPARRVMRIDPIVSLKTM
jgi:putative ABC transport system permease protein